MLLETEVRRFSFPVTDATDRWSSAPASGASCRIIRSPQHSTEKIFPRIKEDFIDTNKVTYTIIPVSFLPNSMPAAIALLCVYYADPLYPNSELFFNYLEYIFSHQPPESVNWTTTKELLNYAKETSPAIDLERLGKCIDKESYRTRIEKNTAYGASLMGGVIATPSLYVNGIKVESLTYESVAKLVQEVMENEGVH